MNLPETCHIAIRFTSINILGELCDWIDNHPESLQPILNFLLYALQQRSGLATAAANALQQICCSCRQHLVSQITGLMEIARHLDGFDIQNDASINLLKGIAGIVGRLPKEQCAAVMMELCNYQTQPLAALLQNAGGAETMVRGERNDPAYWLDRLAAVFRFVNVNNVGDNEQHPCTTVLATNWPILSQCMDKCQADTKIMERSVRCLRYALRCIGAQAHSILEPLVKQMVHVYVNRQHSCLLYLGSILVDEFGKEDAVIAGLLNMLQAFIEPTFNLLQQENGLKNNPDTVDDFFRLANRFVLRCPLDFLKSPLVAPIIQCALLACTLDHREANSSVMKFFCNLLACGRGDENQQIKVLVLQLIAANGEALVVNLVYASIFCLHSYMLQDVVDVFYELKAIEPASLQKFLQTALNALPKKNSGGSVTATDAQLEDFIQRVMRYFNFSNYFLKLSNVEITFFPFIFFLLLSLDLKAHDK